MKRRPAKSKPEAKPDLLDDIMQRMKAWEQTEEGKEMAAHEKRANAVEMELLGTTLNGVDAPQINAILDHVERVIAAKKEGAPRFYEELDKLPPDNLPFSGPARLWRDLVRSLVFGGWRQYLDKLAEQLEALCSARTKTFHGFKHFLVCLHFEDLDSGKVQMGQARKFTLAEIRRRAVINRFDCGTDRNLRHHLQELEIRWLKGKAGRRPRKVLKQPVIRKRPGPR